MDIAHYGPDFGDLCNRLPHPLPSEHKVLGYVKRKWTKRWLRSSTFDEAKTYLSKLLERVRAGEEIILAKGGKPYAKLVPLEHKPREFGFVEGSVPTSFFEPLSDDESEAWE